MRSASSLLLSLLIPSLFAFTALAEPVTIQDSLGRTHRILQPPQRIVSIAPGLTETLFALGLDRTIVGVSDFCDFPPAAAMKPKVGGVTPNVEAIVALRPDLVLATGGMYARELAVRLDRLGISTMGFDSDSIDAVFDRILRLGELTDRRARARDLVDELRERLQAVTARRSTGPPPRVLYLVDEDPYMTVGPPSFLFDVLIKAGASPFEDGREAYPRIGIEAIVRFDPEVIFFADDSPDGGRRRLASWKRWDRITAVREKRLFTIPRGLVNRPGPRIIEAVEVIAEKLQSNRDVSGSQMP